MITKYITESGSVYFINDEIKSWYRIKGVGAAETRTEFGTYIEIDIDLTDDPYHGGIDMICPPFDPKNPVPREITSTRILLYEKMEDWDHPYVADSTNICVICGQVGSYIHTDPKLLQS
jgi:hypothetical protein